MPLALARMDKETKEVAQVRVADELGKISGDLKTGNGAEVGNGAKVSAMAAKIEVLEAKKVA
jgi:hypothetical protein